MTIHPNPEGYVHPIVRQVVNRDCHVSDGYLSVVRHVLHKAIKGHRAKFLEAPRFDQRVIIGSALNQHAANRAEYVAVMRPSYRD